MKKSNQLSKLQSKNETNKGLVIEEKIGGGLLFIIVIILWTVVSSWNKLISAFIKEFFLKGKEPGLKTALLMAIGTTAVFFVVTSVAGLDWQYLIAGDTSAMKKKSNDKAQNGTSKKMTKSIVTMGLSE